MLGCGGGGPYETADRTPAQPRAGRGAAKRSAPTGGSAYGMPRKTASPASRLPRSTPVAERTSGPGAESDGLAAVTVTVLCLQRIGQVLWAVRVRWVGSRRPGPADHAPGVRVPASHLRLMAGWARGDRRARCTWRGRHGSRSRLPIEQCGIGVHLLSSASATTRKKALLS